MYRKQMINSIKNNLPLWGEERGKAALLLPCGTNHGGVLVESEVSLSKEVWCSCHRNHASLMA